MCKIAYLITEHYEIFAVYSDNNTKSINTLCGQNTELFVVKPCDTYFTIGL